MAADISYPAHSDNIQRMQRWVENFIVDLNVCPFAKREVIKNSIRYAESMDTDDNTVFDLLSNELTKLCNHTEIETTILLLPRLDSDFEAFLNVAGFAQQIIQLQGLNGQFQVAHFHPQYQFTGAAVNDPANYTNRAPHAALHLLREASVERAIRGYKNADEIPEHNIQRLRELGLDDMQCRFNKLFADKS